MTAKPGIECIDAFCDADESEKNFQCLERKHHWPENVYTYAGRQFVLPRLQTWHADDGIRYSYSNNLLQTRPWTPLLQTLRDRVETFLQVSFNAVLVNYYRDGEDYVGWHADDEPELGEEPLIASLSFGAERRFAFKHKHRPDRGHVLLRNGSLLIMQPTFQHHWLHSVPKAGDVSQGRINLTFRHVVI